MMIVKLRINLKIVTTMRCHFHTFFSLFYSSPNVIVLTSAFGAAELVSPRNVVEIIKTKLRFKKY